MRPQIKNIGDVGLSENTNVNVPVIVDSTEDKIQNLIHYIRGQQVMIDSDLAMLYNVETKRLNESVKRNAKRFPESFCFQLTEDEYADLRSQIATSNTETENALMFDKLNSLELKQLEYQKESNEKFDQIFAYISEHEEVGQKIFFEGQIYDAFSLLVSLVEKAEKSIVLIDNYVDVGTLNILAKKKDGVDVTIYTVRRTRLASQDIANFNSQYPTLTVNYTGVFHDRFLIVDETTAYHIGASLKDAGKKCFGITRIEDIGIVSDILQRLEIETEEANN